MKGTGRSDSEKSILFFVEACIQPLPYLIIQYACMLTTVADGEEREPIREVVRESMA